MRYQQLALLLIVAVLLNSSCTPPDQKKQDYWPEAQNGYLTLQNYEGPYVQAIQKALPAVVFIQVRQKAKWFLDRSRHFIGSGVIVSRDGYIVTNNHVVEDADQVKVTLHDHSKYTAQIVGLDPNTDLALLKINALALTYLKFRNSDELKVGEQVLAIGNPHGLTFTVTQGIVSAKERKIGLLADAPMPVEALIQTDAPVNPGNSGGPLITLGGELVGINTAKRKDSEGLNFAVPTSTVEKVVGDLKKDGTVHRVALGVCVKNVTPIVGRRGPERISGVEISRVWRNGAAERADLREGDIIVAIDGNSIMNTPQFLERTFRYGPGTTVMVTFYRNGQINFTSVTLQSRRQ